MYEQDSSLNPYKKGSLEYGNVEVIQNDDPFLEATGELWTTYILDEQGDYANFVIDSKGDFLKDANLTNWKDGIIKVYGVKESVMDEICSYIETYKKDGTDYYGYINYYKGPKTEEEIYELFVENEIPFVKRAVKGEVSKTSGFYGWSAYSYDESSPEDLKPLEVGEFSPNKIKVVQDSYNKAVHPDEKEENIFWYALNAERIVQQEEDAQRGMTNLKIKYLFKNKKYYKYDGTHTKAYEISRDWYDVAKLFGENDKILAAEKDRQLTGKLQKIGRTALRTSLFGILGNAILKDSDDASFNKHSFFETALSGYIDNIYYQEFDSLDYVDFKFARDFDDDGIADIASPNLKDSESYSGLEINSRTTKFTYDPRNPNLIGKIDINADSLAAFSILENTHTASADYAYRDFKELIVELDYFDKEDLTEPAKDVLEWPLVETHSAGWPMKTFDKTDNYGSIIHTVKMTDYLYDFFQDYEIGATGFSGFSKNETVVSPATAKIIEMGITTVDNENTEQLFEPFYIVRDDYTDDDLKAMTNQDDEDKATKIMMTQSEKNKILENGEKIENDDKETLGKSYTTGYIKLEVIGQESIDKLCGNDKANPPITPAVSLEDDVKDGLNAFYEDYFNKTQKKTICDSYTIYIEGIDFRLDQTNSSWEFNNTILSKLIENGQNGVTDEEISITDSTGNKVEKTIDNYTERKVPEYYIEAAKKRMKEKEEQKVNMPTIINFVNSESERQIYVKAGTILGLTDEANIKILMKAKDYSIVENVEEYLEIEKIEHNRNQQFDNFSVIGTVLSEDEWVKCALAYASEHPGDGVFNNENNLKEFYQICEKNGVNPEIAFVTAIAEQALDSHGTHNYWGLNTPNGQTNAKSYSSWQEGLEEFCKFYIRYQDPTQKEYNAIMERYNERSTCTENGGCDPNGYGTPDTLQGIQSIYSWLGNNHNVDSAGAGGMYYLHPWHWGGKQYEGENKIIFETEAEFEQLCGKKHGTSGGKMSPTNTTVWEQNAYTAWQIRLKVDKARAIFGEKAGTYAGPTP